MRAIGVTNFNTATLQQAGPRFMFLCFYLRRPSPAIPRATSLLQQAGRRTGAGHRWVEPPDGFLRSALHLTSPQRLHFHSPVQGLPPIPHLMEAVH